jgi:hypothetical protein
LFFRGAVVWTNAGRKKWAWLVLLWPLWPERVAGAKPQAADVRDAGHSATIHWQRVPLRDAVRRLEEKFDERILVDRRVDPGQRVSLDIEASSVEDVLTPIAAPRGLGVARLDGLVYLGPALAAAQLPALAAMRREEISRLPVSQRRSLERSRPLSWPRLTPPREVVASLVGQRGWRVAQAQRIPHDLWAAGELPALTLAEQLTVLLIGFDLTFEVRPRERTLAIVPVEAADLERIAEDAQPQAAGVPLEPRRRVRQSGPETRQVYTLRVVEQPVRAVLQELMQRLDWQIEIDEAAIRAAGRSADTRVSFSVSNVDQDELLHALLRPAELSFRRDGERIKIVPRGSN